LSPTLMRSFRFVWLTLVGFLKHFGLLCRDRLEYMALSVRSRLLITEANFSSHLGMFSTFLLHVLA
jgi:hypothetical protein